MNRKATQGSLLTRFSGALLVLGTLLAGAGSAPAQDERKVTMREAIALALQNSRDLTLARMQYKVALNAWVSIARPSCRTCTQVRVRPIPTVFRRSGSAPAVFQMNYNQALFDPLLKAQQRAAEERAKSQKLEIDRMRDDVIVRTATAYLELAKVRHSLELLRNEQASAEKILEVTRERVEANQELPIEVTRRELTAARVQERIIKLEGREHLAQGSRNLTGHTRHRVAWKSKPRSQRFHAASGQRANLSISPFRTIAGIQEAGK